MFFDFKNCFKMLCFTNCKNFSQVSVCAILFIATFVLQINAQYGQPMMMGQGGGYGGGFGGGFRPSMGQMGGQMGGQFGQMVPMGQMGRMGQMGGQMGQMVPMGSQMGSRMGQMGGQMRSQSGQMGQMGQNGGSRQKSQGTTSSSSNYY